MTFYCEECKRFFTTEYRYAEHEAYKHDRWSGLKEHYRKKGKAPPLFEDLLTEEAQPKHE